MGEVFRARDSRLGREVAIKILPHEISGDPQRLARFEREARSASALNHPNIITIHDFSSQDGEAWLVMELIRGESLRHLISRGQLPMKKLLAIAAGVADGLAVAHAAGIVHRDLKPENVMLTADGSAKILDFGLVKQASVPTTSDSPTEPRMSLSGAVMGTAAYMSPEQARGEDVDFRSDQFSFGLILSEMATGKHPFQRSTVFETLAAILTDDPEPLSESLPEPFVWIVDRCLAKEPARRYGSTSDLAHDLGRLRNVGDRTTNSRPRPAVPRRRSWVIPAAVLFVAALALFLAGSLWNQRGRPAIVPPVPTHASISTPEFVDVSLDEAALPVALSPDGHYVVVYGKDADGRNNLSLHDLRTGEIRVIAENAAFSAGWATDSKAIVYISEGKLKTQAVDGSPPRTICEARPEGTPSWNGDTILFGQYSVKVPGIYAVSAGGGSPRLVIGREETEKRGLPWWPQFLPDGKRFLFRSTNLSPEIAAGRRELRVASLDSSPSELVARIDSRAEFANGYLLFVREGTLLAQPFDPETARLSGETTPVVDGLHYFGNTGNAGFSVSQNGLLAWRTARNPVRLVWLDPGGVEVGAVGTGLFTPAGRFSPDGSRYAVGIVDPKQGSSDLWVYDLTRESSVRLTFQGFDEKAAVWAPDGGTIYYRSDGHGGPPDILKLLSGASAGEIVYRGPGVEEPQDVSPDGKWLLFVDLFASGSRVHVLPLDPPGPPRPLTGAPFNEFSPRFSPDGKWVAYSSDMSGRPEVYVRPFEGSGASMRISRDGGARPRWRKDGKELFFLGREGRLMTVPINADGSAGTPGILFQASGAVDYEPVADGTRFLVQLEERSNEPVVKILVNWPARLAP